VIRQLRAALGKGFPIIGVGGILSAADAVSKIAPAPTWCRSTPA
jgi:dihydroorotate dehydrogenase